MAYNNECKNAKPGFLGGWEQDTNEWKKNLNNLGNQDISEKKIRSIIIEYVHYTVEKNDVTFHFISYAYFNK